MSSHGPDPARMWVITGHDQRFVVYRLDPADDALREVTVPDIAPGEGQEEGKSEPGPGADHSDMRGAARSLSAALEGARHRDSYDSLIMVAPEHVLALLGRELSPVVRRVVVAELVLEEGPHEASAIRAILPV